MSELKTDAIRWYIDNVRDCTSYEANAEFSAHLTAIKERDAEIKRIAILWHSAEEKSTDWEARFIDMCKERAALKKEVTEAREKKRKLCSAIEQLPCSKLQSDISLMASEII